MDPVRKENMVTIRWDKKTRLFPPAISIDFFRTRLELWEKLKKGEAVEVPYDTATLIHGVIIEEAKKKDKTEATPKEGDKDAETGSMGT